MTFQIQHISQYRGVGSKRYESKSKRFLDISGKTWVSILIIVIVTFILAYIAWYGNQVDKTNKLFGSLVYAKTKDYTKTDSVSEHDQIKNYISQVFGGQSDKAFTLLSCENKSLNPNAVNDNTTWGGVGQDIGVFQINNTWQKTQDKFLLNWKINIEIAKQLFDENGGHFSLWTCGRNLGI